MDKIFFINRSFYPDIEATGQFFTELAESLSKNFNITFICGLSFYVKDKNDGFKFYRKEKLGKIKIIRIRHTLFWKENIFGRIINWLTFSINSFFVLLKTRPKILICGTDPPILGIISYFLKKLKNINYIYYCNDLYPDIAIALNTFRNNFIVNIFEYLNRKALKNSLKIIVLGEDMKELVKRKGIKDKKILVIPNWVDTKKIVPIDKDKNLFLKKYNFDNKFLIMYSGNIGLPHNLENLIYALEKIRDKDWTMVFIGDGVKKKEIFKIVKEKNLLDKILFLPYEKKEFLSHSLSAADLHIVSLKKEAKGACVPSKIYGILASGRPFLSISHKSSNSSLIAERYKCGIICEPDNVEDIKNKIEWAIENKENLKEMGKRAREIAILIFDKEIVMNKWKKFLEEISD